MRAIHVPWVHLGSGAMSAEIIECLFDASGNILTLDCTYSRVPNGGRGNGSPYVSRFVEASLKPPEQVLACGEKAVSKEEHPPNLVVLGTIMRVLDHTVH